MKRQIRCHRETKRQEETVTERDRGDGESLRVEVTGVVHFLPPFDPYCIEMNERDVSSASCLSPCICYTRSTAIDQALLRLSHRGLLQHVRRFRPVMILWITGREVEGRALDAGGRSLIDELLRT